MTNRQSYDPFAPPPFVTAPDEDVWPDLDETEPPVDTIPDDLDDISKDDLIELAEQAGVATWGTKAQIAQRVRDAR